MILPIVGFDMIDNHLANDLLVAWKHEEGACNRPFLIQSFALHVRNFGPVAVAVSASTVSATCGGMACTEILELARLCTHPDYRWATRVTLRLWRQIAPSCYSWHPRALVSYAKDGKTGDVYRFDGWRRHAEVSPSGGGGTWSKRAPGKKKTLWVFEEVAA